MGLVGFIHHNKRTARVLHQWIMERYAITTNKDSGITNNPNDWQVENPRYIFNLLLSIIRVSVETVRIVEGLGGVGKLKVWTNTVKV